MFFKLKWLAQILIYTLIIGVGGWLFYTRINHPLPFPEEAPHLLTAAAHAEELCFDSLPEETTAKELPFHRCASLFVQFISEAYPSGYRIRTYRLFPMILSLLFLMLIPALGLKRRGGCFETEDTPFWIALFVLATPPFLSYGNLFLPLSFQALLFLGLLVAFRAYVQWPGYLSTLFIAFFISLSISIESAMTWVILVMLPAIGIGVGWRRIRLYWNTRHFILLSALISLYLVISLAFEFISPFSFPTLHPTFSGLYHEALWRFIWLTAGGFGVVAWLGLLFWSFSHPDRRWFKVFITLFPLFFILSFGFERGGGFAVPLSCLSLILSGMALSIIPLFYVRLIVGGCTLAVLTLGMNRFLENRLSDQLPIVQQKITALTLRDHCRQTPTEWKKVYLQFTHPERCAQTVWPIRQSALLSSDQQHLADICIADAHDPTHASTRHADVRSIPLTMSTTIYLLSQPSPRTLP